MKSNRIIAVLLCVALAFSLVACGGGASSEAPAPAPAPAPSAAPAPAPKAVEWPDGPVQFFVPSKAGGVTDIYTRFLQESLQTSTKGNFATVNYDTEAVGYEKLRSSKPDGATLLFQHSTVICKYLTGAIDYDPSKEFTVVGEVAYMGSQAIIAAPNSPFDTWEGFVEYAKANPGKLNTAIATNGTTHFIFGQVQQKCGVELNFVECSSEADKLTNVAGGIIDIANCSLGNAREYEKAGKIKVLGLLGSGQPEPNYPEWKPITDVLWSSHLYCFAPAGIDEATARAINEKLKSVLDDPKFKENCESIGGAPEWFSLEDVQADFAKTIKELSGVATALGINIRA